MANDDYSSPHFRGAGVRREILQALMRFPTLTTADLANRLCRQQSVVRGRLSRLHVWGYIAHDGAIPRTWRILPRGRRIAMTGAEIDEFVPRVERIGDATLFLADCRDILPEIGCVDATVTDPPYGIDFSNQGGFSAKRGWRTRRGDAPWDVVRPEKELFQELRRKSVHQIIWGAQHFADSLPPSKCWLVWDKGQRSFSVGDCELAWTSLERAPRILSRARGKDSLNREHPTQKPLELMYWCLGFLDDVEGLEEDEPKTVLDPFMGSGTTGVACVQRGMKFIGVEKDPRYFEIACRRIEQAQNQPSLLGRASGRAAADQSDMFAVTGCAEGTRRTA